MTDVSNLTDDLCDNDCTKPKSLFGFSIASFSHYWSALFNCPFNIGKTNVAYSKGMLMAYRAKVFKRECS